MARFSLKLKSGLVRHGSVIAASNVLHSASFSVEAGNESWSSEKREKPYRKGEGCKDANSRGAEIVFEERGSPSVYSKVRASRAAYVSGPIA
jgi:hypothetical protein